MTLTIEGLLGEAREVLRLERPDLAATFQGFRDDLIAAHQEGGSDEAALVRGLEERWAAMVNARLQNVELYDELFAAAGGPEDPAGMPVTLFGVSGRSRDEVSHTEVLGNLLDGHSAFGSGELAKRLLAALLPLLDGALEGAGVTGAVKVEVEPPWPLGSVTRFPDLVIETEVEQEPIRLVIENKIDAVDHAGQLDHYAQYAHALSDSRRTLLAYLTPRGDEPVVAEGKEAWTCLSYVDLCINWRRVLTRTPNGPWRDVLRLYLATLVQEVWNVGHQPSDSLFVRARLIPYLRAATEK